MALDLAKLRELAPHEKFVTTPRATWLALLALLDRLEAAEKACAIAVEGCTNNWDTQVGELPLDQTLPGRLRAALDAWRAAKASTGGADQSRARDGEMEE